MDTTKVPAIEEVARELDLLSRAPFQRSLAKMLGAEPSLATLRKFAEAHPHRWGQLVSQFASLAGYAQGVEVKGEHLHIHAIGSLSDLELRHAIAQELRRMQGGGEEGLLPAPLTPQEEEG